MILRRQIHIVERERFLLRGPIKPLILGTPQQVQRIAPNLTFRHVLRGGRRVAGNTFRCGLPAADPWADMIDGHLLCKSRKSHEIPATA